MLTTPKSLTLILSCLMSVCLITSVHAQRPASPDKLIRALINQDVANEIELVDEQKDTINEYLSELKKIRNVIEDDKKMDFRNAPSEDREKIASAYARRIQVLESKIADRIKDTLLPFQMERTEQLILQRKFGEGKNRITGGLLSQSIIEYLEISEEQQKRIKEKSVQLDVEIKNEIRKIVDRAKKQLLDELNDDQKSKYESLLGDPIKPEDKKP